VAFADTSSRAPLIEETEATLEEASGVIANGYLRLDLQEWIRAVEKRRAAPAVPASSAAPGAGTMTECKRVWSGPTKGEKSLGLIGRVTALETK
jgi:hypothetical protein